MSKVLERVSRAVPDLHPVPQRVFESVSYAIGASILRKGADLRKAEFRRLVNSLSRTKAKIRRLHKRVGDDQTMIIVKKHLAYLLALAFHDPVAIESSWAATQGLRQLFYGYADIHLKRLRSKNHVCEFYSLQKGTKNAWLPMSSDFVHGALRDHKENLCPSGSVAPLSDQAKAALCSASYNLFSGIREKDLRKFKPQIKATFTVSRRLGGHLQRYDDIMQVIADQDNDLRLGGGVRDSQNPGDASCLGDVPPWRYPFMERVRHLENLLGPNCVWRKLHGLNRWRQISHEQDRCFVLNQLEEHIESCDDITVDAAWDVKVIPLLEPAKVRIITVGAGPLVGLCQPLQGALIDCVKRSVWSTMLHPNLYDQFVRISEDTSDEWVYYSIDYSSATDKAKMSATNTAILGIGKGELGQNMRALARLSFLPARLHYPKASKITAEVQRNGQLMGHPLSFALLCCINRAVVSLGLQLALQAGVISRSDVRTILKKKRFLINGDDLCLRGPKGLMVFLVRAAKEYGLEISPGKTFESRTHGMINSQLFRRNKDGSISKLAYLNQRFLFKDTTKALPLVGSAINDMMQYNPRCRGFLTRMQRVLSENLSGKSHIGFVPNFFLPIHLGGLGIEKWDGLEEQDCFVSRPQRLMAHHFTVDPTLTLFRKVRFQKHSDGEIKSLVDARLVTSEDGWFTVPDGWSQREPAIAGRCQSVNRFLDFHHKDDFGRYEEEEYRMVRLSDLQKKRKLLHLSKKRIRQLQTAIWIYPEAVQPLPSLTPLNNLEGFHLVDCLIRCEYEELETNVLRDIDFDSPEWLPLITE